MILEFALTLTLTPPIPSDQVMQVQFTEPVRRVVTYPPNGVVNQLSGLPLPEDVQAAYDAEFLSGSTYFGAFAVAKDFSYGYATGINSPQAAREIALAECQQFADRCLVYAEIVPEGFLPLGPGEVTMSAEAAGYYLNPNPAWGDFRAMAISEDGAYSVTWNYGTRDQAAAAALADCTSYLTTDLPGVRAMPCILLPFK